MKFGTVDRERHTKTSSRPHEKGLWKKICRKDKFQGCIKRRVKQWEKN